MTSLAVPIPADLISQIILRSRGRHDVATVVSNVVSDFLDRTYGDADIWSDEHAAEATDHELQDRLREYGDPAKGYFWQSAFLPNGTQIRCRTKGQVAEVKRQQVVFNGTPMSPSRFASACWNGTQRSAPRDLEVRRPDDIDWVWARALLGS